MMNEILMSKFEATVGLIDVVLRSLTSYLLLGYDLSMFFFHFFNYNQDPHMVVLSYAINILITIFFNIYIDVS